MLPRLLPVLGLLGCGALLALSDCGSIQDGFPELTRCTHDSPVLVPGVTPQASVDFLEEVEPELGGVVGSTGTVCATAKDAGACTAALDAAVNSPGVTIPPGCGIPGPCDGHILAYTVGDAVGVVTRPAEAVGFFGTVDSPEEAIFLAFRHNYQVSCTGDTRGGVRAVSGGYEVLATQSGCGYLARIIVFVGADGTVQERQRDVLSEGASCVH